MFGFRLDAYPVRPEPTWPVATKQGPHHADQVEHTGDVTHRGVGPVDVAVEELHGLGDLMVDLQDGGHGHQDQEREVDEGVHDAGRRFPKQGLHVDARSEVAEPSLGVAGRGGPVVGGAALPVLDPV